MSGFDFDIRQEMPMLAKHEGEWKGEYILVDDKGNVIDRHASHLTCTFPEEGPNPYLQINHYTWADGKDEKIFFPADYDPARPGKIWFDNERIKGWAGPVPMDDYGRTMMLNWVRKDMPGSYLYEMIQLDDTETKRARVWQWFKDGELFQRTIIKETKVA